MYHDLPEQLDPRAVRIARWLLFVMGGVAAIVTASVLIGEARFDVGTVVIAGMGVVCVLSACFGPPRWVVTLVVLSLGGGSSAT